MSRHNFALRYTKAPAFVQPGKKTPAKSHVLEQASVNLRQSALFRINQDGPRHGTEHLQFAAGRIIIRLGIKSEAHQAVFHSVILEVERVRNGLEHLLRFFTIIFDSFSALGPLFFTADQFPHAFFIPLALLGCERMAMDKDSPRKFAVPGFNYVAIVIVLIVLTMETITPMGMIVVLSINAVINRLADKLVGISGKFRAALLLDLGVLDGRGRVLRRQQCRRRETGHHRSHQKDPDCGTPLHIWTACTWCHY